MTGSLMTFRAHFFHWIYPGEMLASNLTDVVSHLSSSPQAGRAKISSRVREHVHRRSLCTMTRMQHLQAAGLAIAVLLSGEIFYNMLPGQYSLRGTSDVYAERIEKRANNTLEIFMKTVKEQSLEKEELESIIVRLKGIEEKLQEPKEDTPKLHDIEELQEKLSSLDGKLKTHEGTSVSDKDLKALEERLSSFESKMNDNDLVTLKERMSSFENKLKAHEDGIVKKEDLELLNEFISLMEEKINTLHETSHITPSDHDGGHQKYDTNDPVKEATASSSEEQQV